MRRALDAATQLVKLCQAESLRTFYHHHRRIRYIDADLYDRCRDEYMDLSAGEGRRETSTERCLSRIRGRTPPWRDEAERERCCHAALRPRRDPCTRRYFGRRGRHQCPECDGDDDRRCG